MSVIIPKEENKDKGFHYTVTDEQIKEHQKKSIEEIFEWLETTSAFIYFPSNTRRKKTFTRN